MFALSPADAAYRITFDMGGQLSSFITKYQALRDANAHVVIDGECVSACTLVTTLEPKDVCITPRAVLGFIPHSSKVLMAARSLPAMARSRCGMNIRRRSVP